MSINVIFDKNGFFHDAYGRMGRGRHAGQVYTLDDAFREPGMLPRTAQIIEDKEVLEEVLDAAGQRKPLRPTVASEEALAKARQRRGIGATKKADASDVAKRASGRRRKLS